MTQSWISFRIVLAEQLRKGKQLWATINILPQGMPFYFPKPHAPWQRGTNENTNGLIREYCPKTVDMNSFDDSHFQTFIDKLNKRPRKCLGWKSPYEVFYDKVLHLT